MVGFGGLEEVYTSRVVGKPFESVTVSSGISLTSKGTSELTGQATAAKQSPLFKSLKTTCTYLTIGEPTINETY